jgi:hypothetical protein
VWTDIDNQLVGEQMRQQTELNRTKHAAERAERAKHGALLHELDRKQRDKLRKSQEESRLQKVERAQSIKAERLESIARKRDADAHDLEARVRKRAEAGRALELRVDASEAASAVLARQQGSESNRDLEQRVAALRQRDLETRQKQASAIREATKASAAATHEKAAHDIAIISQTAQQEAQLSRSLRQATKDEYLDRAKEQREATAALRAKIRKRSQYARGTLCRCVQHHHGARVHKRAAPTRAPCACDCQGGAASQPATRR